MSIPLGFPFSLLFLGVPTLLLRGILSILFQRVEEATSVVFLLCFWRIKGLSSVCTSGFSIFFEKYSCSKVGGREGEGSF